MTTPIRQRPISTLRMLRMEGRLSGRITLVRQSMRLPWSVFMSLILSGSVDMKLVYRFRILPKTARDMAVMMMVFMLLPSHTMKMGAMADFGRLFRMTKYGSRISLKVWFHQSSTAMRMVKTATRRKLPKVSARVMPM